MQPAIHDPYSAVTPRQLVEAVSRRARLQRLNSFPRSTATEPTPVDKTERPPAVEERAESWAERQKRLFTKEPWFSIVCEIDPAEPRRPRVQEIINATAKYYGVSRSDIVSARRTAVIVRPRQVVYYLAKKLTLCSLPEIGRRIGDRDHTSILSGLRKIERLRKVDAALDSDVLAITASLAVST